MCSLVQDLYASLHAVQTQVAGLAVVNADLAKQVQELKAKVAMDSHNSSKPPSSDGYKKPPKPRNLRVKTGRKPGGQDGHAGYALEPVSKPDYHVMHAPKTCGSCGHSLDNAEVIGRDSHQIFDLPELKLEVTEHEIVSCVCPHCQALNRGEFPDSAMQPTQYGPRFLGVLTYLNQYQLIPLARTQECIGDLFGHRPSQATITNALAHCAKWLEPVEAAIKKAIAEAAVANFDETGMRVAKLLQWVHTASTLLLTFYYRHGKRGGEAFEEIGILKDLKGTAVHDCLVSYFNQDFICQHAVCNAHLLREMIGTWENTHETWTQRMSSLLRSLKRAKEAAQAAGQHQLDPQLLQRYHRVYRRIVARGLLKNPAPERTGNRGRPANGKTRSLLLRLDNHEKSVLRFAKDFAVPFDNNLAERDLRMVKLHQKISGCFRSEAGANQFCTIRGYISTLRKQGINVMSALCAGFDGDIVWPSLKPSQ
jgi:transposase